MNEKKKKTRLLSIADTETLKKILEILKAIDPKDIVHAVDVLTFSLIIQTSHTLFEAIGRFDMMKKRIYDFVEEGTAEEWLKTEKEFLEREKDLLGS